MNHAESGCAANDRDKSTSAAFLFVTFFFIIEQCFSVPLAPVAAGAQPPPGSVRFRSATGDRLPLPADGWGVWGFCPSPPPSLSSLPPVSTAPPCPARPAPLHSGGPRSPWPRARPGLCCCTAAAPHGTRPCSAQPSPLLPVANPVAARPPPSPRRSGRLPVPWPPAPRGAGLHPLRLRPGDPTPTRPLRPLRATDQGGPAHKTF